MGNLLWAAALVVLSSQPVAGDEKSQDKPTPHTPEGRKAIADAIAAEFRQTLGKKEVTLPTEVYGRVEGNRAFWKSDEGQGLFRRVLTEPIASLTVRINVLHHQARAKVVPNLAQLIKEGIAANVRDDLMRAGVADLFEYVADADKDLAFMFYCVFSDPSASVRRNMAYQLPAKRLTAPQKELLAAKMNDGNEWIFARIGVAWRSPRPGTPPGTRGQRKAVISLNRSGKSCWTRSRKPAEHPNRRCA